MPPATGQDMLMQFMPLFFILIVFYFLLLRPQQKKMKEHKTMLDNLRRGDKIVTSGGIVGTIHKLDGDDYLVVDIAEGVHIKLARAHVQDVLSKTEPANNNQPSPKAIEKK
ncbi:MAG: preprotein translocase subunit YajC [Alphaproteobacteria bacterium]|nr:preprotein translocase subunit YajC [Alphaproteobacteria bacterium]